MKFNELGLSEKVLNAVEASGYDTPTPIQAQAIPYALEGRDVLGIAQTGTGKTAAFTLPMLSMLERGRARARMPRSLILEPTRELAAQVEEAFSKYGVNHKLSVALLIGGVSDGDQKAKIDRGADVVIATPGRLLDLTERGRPSAHRHRDSGHRRSRPHARHGLHSGHRAHLQARAVHPPDAVLLRDDAARNHPAGRHLPPQSGARRSRPRGDHRRKHHPDAGAHRASAPPDKRATLRRIVRGADNFKNAIIFCNRKRDVQVVYRSLEKHGFSVGALHGDLDQRARMAALDAFRNDQVQLLVCSDVAARGLDIPDVSHVINYDAPHHSEDYVHRIGRTGRAGKTGQALTIVTRADSKAIAEIEKLIARKIDWQAGAEMPPDGRGRRPARDSGGERGRRSGRRREAGAEERPRPDHHPEHRAESRRHHAERPAKEREAAEKERVPEQRRHHAERPVKERAAAEKERVPEQRRHQSARPPQEGSAEPERAPARRPPRFGESAGHERPRREAEQRVVGLGDHVPSFLLRPVPKRARPHPEHERVED